MEKISIYDRQETDFNHNGIVLNQSTLCDIEEELNGMYMLELEYPAFGNDKYNHLKEENIIKADGQLFRIYSSVVNFNYIEVKARHIFYDLLHNFLEDVRPTSMNLANALDWTLSRTQYPHKFRSMSDVGTISTRYFERVNPVEAILGDDGLIARWGGEIVRDNHYIRVYRNRGSNKGSQIAYGKNLNGLQVSRDMDELATRIMPVAKDGLLLPEKYIDSPLINNYNQPYIKEVKVSMGVKDAVLDDDDIIVEEAITETEVFEEMRRVVNNLYEIDKVDVPTVNIVADLISLENTEEYKDLKALEIVNLGDTVSCTDNPLKVDFEAKVIRIKKDIISGMNVEVELGQFKKDLSSSFDNVIKDIVEDFESDHSDLEEAVKRATDSIVNTLGGYVIKRKGELLIMDTEDPKTATTVWRWNLGGLGYSSNGIDGPFDLAMTMDGEIVANFITSGELNASIIKAGVIRPQRNIDNYWNMENGYFKMSGISYDASGFKIMLGNKTAEQTIIDSATGAVSDANNYTWNIYSSISSTVDDINLEVGKKIGADEVVSSINVQPARIKIDTKNLNLSGNLNLTGVFTSLERGRDAIKMDKSKLDFYDWDGTGSEDPVGTIFSSRAPGDTNRPGLAINNEADNVFSIGYSRGTTYGTYVSFDKDDILGGLHRAYPIVFRENTHFRSQTIFADGMRVGNVGNSRVYMTGNKLYINGTSGGFQLGDNNGKRIIDWLQGVGNYPLSMWDNLYVDGDFKVNGTNLSSLGARTLNTTANYGERETNSYETAEEYFGDVGSGLINKDGECMVHIDEIFQETANTNINYHIFTQKYNGKIDKINKKNSYFTVYGEPNTKFSWEIKAKKKDAELNRLEVSNTDNKVMASNLDNDLIEIKDKDNELSRVLNEVLEYNLTDTLLEGAWEQ